MLTWNESLDVSVDLTEPALLRKLARAQALADVIREIPVPPRVQQRLHRLNVLRAVRGTAAIEGNELSATEVQRIADAPPGEQVLGAGRETEELEARNAYECMRFIAATLDEQPDTPFSADLLLELHRRMTAGIDDDRVRPGRFRERAVKVGDFQPPPAERVPELVERFVAWCNADHGYDALTRAVLTHFFVASIHPFADGNGRTARAAESFFLYRRDERGGGINTRGFYSLANYYYRQRAEYFELLDRVRADPVQDATPLILFAATGLEAELKALCDEILQQVRIIAFRDFVRNTLSQDENLRPANRARLQRFVLSLVDLQAHTGQTGVPLHQLRQGEGLLAALYEAKSLSTLNRDVKLLGEMKLVLTRDGWVRANLEVMNEFTN